MATDYVRHVSDYFEREIDERHVTEVFAHRPISRELATQLNPDVDWDKIAEELFTEIGYPR